MFGDISGIADSRKHMDNFKFMDPWAASVRWTLVLPVAGVVAAIYYLVQNFINDVLLIPLGVGLFVWCPAATAPRLKMGVAAVFGLAVLVWTYVEYQSLVREANNPIRATDAVGIFAGALHSALSRVFLDLYQHFFVPAIVAGVIVAWGLVVWGYLRRRRAALPSG